MNVLLLSPWLPWPPFDGARIRIFETLRYLSRRHRITLLAPIRHPADLAQTAALKEFCECIVTSMLPDATQAVLPRLMLGSLRRLPLIHSFHYDRQLAQRVGELTFRHAYDIVHMEFPFLAPYLAAINPRSQAKKILSMHNVESIRFARELRHSGRHRRRLLIQWDRLFFPSWEQQVMQQFDGITAVSELERTWIQRQAPTTRVALVPNGVDCEYFCPDDAVSANPSILFTGMMNHPPNVDAAEWFSQEIFPRLRRELPDLCFTIVGSRPHARVMALGQRPGVHITGEVEDVRPYIAGCSAFVVPLRSGGGTRLKILQAMAMERPVISTSLGAEGLEVTPGVNILIAENPAEFVKHILGLAASPEAACQLGKAGRRLVEAQYDWPICLQGLESLYDTLLGNPHMRQTSVLPELEGA